MNTTLPTETLFGAAYIAEILGVTEYDLQKMHPADLGVPGEWRMNPQGAVVYTVRGALALAKAAQNEPSLGKCVEGHVLEVKIRQHIERPSGSHGRHDFYYRQGQLA